MFDLLQPWHFFVLTIILPLYCLPSIIAWRRHAKAAVGVVILNLFLGWTFVGWVVALVWAAVASNNATAIVATSPAIAAGRFQPGQITWTHRFDKPIPHRLEYSDRYGEVKEATVELFSDNGTHPNGHQYIGAFHNGTFKTYRKDRVLRLQPLN